MSNKKNIIVGAARIALGPSPINALGQVDTAALTDLKASTGTQWDHMFNTDGTAKIANWRNVGYTQDGLEVATDPSWGEVEVDQLLDTPKIFKDGMGFTVSTTFAESTLENLLIAWGQSNSFAAGTFGGSEPTREIEIDGGSLGQAPVERGLVAVGNAPEKSDSNAYGERTYFVYRVLSVDATSTSLARAEAATIPVSFRALPAGNGKYGSIRDRMNV